MTASTTARSFNSEPISPRQGQVAPATKVLRGALAGRFTTGANRGYLAEIGTSPAMVIEGLFDASVDNSVNATAGADVFVVDDIITPMLFSAVDASNEGQMAYGVDNQTCALTSNGGTYPEVGEVWEVPNGQTTMAYVRVGRIGVARARSSGAGELPGAPLTDASVTVLAAAGKWRVLPAATLTAPRTATVDPTGLKAGDSCTITRLDATANAYTIVNGGPAAGTLLVMPASKVNFVDLVFDGTNLILKRCGTQ